MAWNIGANDLANAMGTVVGTGGLSIRQVIVLAAVFEFLGAVYFGSRVTETIAKGIVPIDRLGELGNPGNLGNGPAGLAGGVGGFPHMLALGMLAAVLAAGFWVTFATFYNLPVSTSHASVGGMLGFGLALAYRGIIPYSLIRWPVLARIVASWLISPVLGAVLAFLLFVLIRTLVLHRVEKDVEKYFVGLQVITACYLAFAHGSNDVAGAVGPLSAAFARLGLIGGEEVPAWLFMLGGVGMVLGLSTWGYRVIETVGSKITELTPSRGFAAQFATASVVLLHSYVSLPISTTHILVGSVIGVGLAGGLSAVDLSVVWKIVFSWIVTVPVAALTSALLFLGFGALGV
ncbi:MAG: inorganic phosphate transporter [Methanosarcinaceae archaeon]|nr:inorganic phosphate transporter [Methanosarcinaceae archaeon]